MELGQAEANQAKTMRIRAGVKWAEEKEKSTRYFLGRFKTRCAMATMHVLT